MYELLIPPLAAVSQDVPAGLSGPSLVVVDPVETPQGFFGAVDVGDTGVAAVAITITETARQAVDQYDSNNQRCRVLVRNRTLWVCSKGVFYGTPSDDIGDVQEGQAGDAIFRFNPV